MLFYFMEMRPEDLGLADKGSFPFSYLLLHKFQIKNYSEIVLIKKKKKKENKCQIWWQKGQNHFTGTLKSGPKVILTAKQVSLFLS